MKVVQGDLIQLAKEGKFDVIIHGCNCFHTMGAGVAYGIKKNFPEAYQADLQTKLGDRSKLGDYSFCRVDRLDQDSFFVVNAYTQFDFGGNKMNVSYEALRSVFKMIKRDFSGLQIGYPAIGAGLAGGDWDKIYAIICKELDGENHTFVEYRV